MPRFGYWLGLSGLIIVLDQLTKYWVVSALRLGQSIELTSFLNLVFVFNPGAAFSFLSDAGGWQRWFFVVLAIAVSVWLTFLIRHHAAERMLPLAAAMILGGALGNVIDRIEIGAVVDFLDFSGLGFPWIFNIADSAISVGVALLILDSFLSERRSEPVGSEAQTE